MCESFESTTLHKTTNPSENVKTTLSLATVALLFLGLGPTAQAQNLFLHGGIGAPSGNVFLLTNSSTVVRGWLSVDGVSRGVITNDNDTHNSCSAQPASKSLHVRYLDNNVLSTTVLLTYI